MVVEELIYTDFYCVLWTLMLFDTQFKYLHWWMVPRLIMAVLLFFERVSMGEIGETLLAVMKIEETT